MSDYNCERCGAPKVPGYMSVEEFKAAFKPGDIILGWSTRKRCKVTAIGDECFLYRDLDLDSFRNHGSERVAKIRQNFNWEKE